MKKIDTTLRICGNCQHMTDQPCTIAGMSERKKCAKDQGHVKHMSKACDEFEVKGKEHVAVVD